jgi:prevent-host-death family protein
LSKDFSVAEAKAHFADCLRSAERGEPVVITRHGKRVAAVVAAEDLERLERLRAAGPEGGLASVAGGWEDSEAVVKAIRGFKRSRPRSPRGR